MTKETPPSLHREPKTSCRNCDGVNWVCENHRDRPWAGLSNHTDACECGAGASCPVCQPELAAAPSLHREPIEADRELYLKLGIFHTCEDRMILAGWADDSKEMQEIVAHRLAFSTPAASDAEALRPHIEKLRRCAPINDDMGRVVNGQTEAMRQIVRWFDALPLPKAGEQFAENAKRSATPSTEGRNGEDQADG